MEKECGKKWNGRLKIQKKNIRYLLQFHNIKVLGKNKKRIVDVKELFDVLNSASTSTGHSLRTRYEETPQR